MDRGPTFGCFFGHGRLEGANTLKLKKDQIFHWIWRQVNCTIIRLWDKFNDSFYEVNHSSSRTGRTFLSLYEYFALFCFPRSMYHIFEVHLSHVFCWRKKWRSLFILLFCGLHTPSIKWPSDIFNDHNGIGNCLQKIEFGDFLGEGIVLCQCHIFMNQAKQRLCQVDTSLCFSLFCLNLINPS